MDREELIGLGDASIRRALADMFVILNKDGDILTKIGGIGDSDKMAFSPRLECDRDCSVMLFDDEDKARGTIETILAPQDDGDYHIFKFTSISDGDDGDSENECEFDVECDSDDECGENEDSSPDNSASEDFTSIDKSAFSDSEMTLDDAIEHAREAGNRMLSENPDCSCGKEHLQLAKWLEELRNLRNANGESDDVNSDEDENGTLSVDGITRILKRNGYQLVSQDGHTQCWKKE